MTLVFRDIIVATKVHYGSLKFCCDILIHCRDICLPKNPLSRCCFSPQSHFSFVTHNFVS